MPKRCMAFDNALLCIEVLRQFGDKGQGHGNGLTAFDPNRNDFHSSQRMTNAIPL
jgi:hypothetical protein